MLRTCLLFARKAPGRIGNDICALTPRFRLIRCNRFSQVARKPVTNTTVEESTLQLLRREMMMKRIAHIEVPFGLGTINFPYSLSNIAGHGSFLCLAVSYLESDVVYLRIYAFSGISLSILFQYCREVPLWIPIRWNSLFLIINALMIALLIKEANDASNIPEEQEELFMTVFSKHSMKPVDFLRLMSIAERREVAEGDKIVEQGRKHQHLHLIQSGKLSVRRDNDQVGVIHAHQFAGAMSFLTWEGNYEIRRNARKEREGEFLLWEEFSDSGWGGLKLNLPGIGGSDGSERRKEREEIDWELGYADVTCEEDCVVYSWSFKDLHELLAEHPRIGLVVEGCISKDLNKKMTATWLMDPQQKYKQILTAALNDGEVTKKERRGFKKFCREHHISYEKHLQLLNECGWTEEEYIMGYKHGTRLMHHEGDDSETESLITGKTGTAASLNGSSTSQQSTGTSINFMTSSAAVLAGIGSTSLWIANGAWSAATWPFWAVSADAKAPLIGDGVHSRSDASESDDVSVIVQRQAVSAQHFYKVGADGKLVKLSMAEVAKLHEEEERERRHMKEQYESDM